MRRSWTRLAFAAMALLLTVGSVFGGTAQAKQGGRKARMSWSVKRIREALAPAATRDVMVTLSSDRALTDVDLVVTKGLAGVVAVSPANIATLGAGESVEVKVTLTMPLDGRHNYGGVLQAQQNGRKMGNPLQIKIELPDDEDSDDDDDDDEDED